MEFAEVEVNIRKNVNWEDLPQSVKQVGFEVALEIKFIDVFTTNSSFKDGEESYQNAN